MSAARRPNELDLHAIVDDRLDRLRARELEVWLREEALLDERLEGWRRSHLTLRAVYDPILSEPPPLFLTLALRAAQPPRAGETAPAPARRPAGSPAGAPVASAPARFPLLVVVVSFLLGATSVVVGAAIFAHFADPARPDVATGVARALTLLARGLGFGS
jgi:anti-sigma factor RsiW